MSKTIEISEKIAAPKEKVFPYLLEGKKLIEWFPTMAETDPVVGGHYMFTFEFAAPEQHKGNHIREGKFLEIKPGEKLRYEWSIGPTEVEFDLKQNGTMTELQLKHTGWKDTDIEEIQSHTQGWTFFLQNLKTLLEEGEDRRTSTMGLVSKK